MTALFVGSGPAVAVETISDLVDDDWRVVASGGSAEAPWVILQEDDDLMFCTVKTGGDEAESVCIPLD